MNMLTAYPLGVERVPPQPPEPHQPAPPVRPANAFVVTASRHREAWIDPDNLKWSFSRSSGPGGQNVNKVNTRAELRVRPETIQGLDEAAQARLAALVGRRLTRDGEMIFSADTHRSQLDNREACLERLRAVIKTALIPPRPRKPTKPSRASKQRRLDSKRKDSDKKSSRRWSED